MGQLQEERIELPTMFTVTATEFQNNFSKYRKKVKDGAEITITANGKEEMVITKAKRRKFSDLAGMYNGLLGNVDAKEAGEMRRRAYYGKD